VPCRATIPAPLIVLNHPRNCTKTPP
jgi:hypothetical protein